MRLDCPCAVVYGVAQNRLSEAKRWYSEAFRVSPNFDEEFYVGFDIHGFGLGLKPVESMPERSGNKMICTYWRVDDIEAEFARLLELGAKTFADVSDVGGGIKVCTLKDPFGNVIGLVYNPSFACTASFETCASDEDGGSPMLGIGTVVYACDNISSAKKWYQGLFGSRANFDEPYYVGYTTQTGFELGLMPLSGSREELRTPPKVTTYWHVNKMSTATRAFTNKKAKPYLNAEDVGGGVEVSSFIDPMENVLGLMYNPNFKDTRKRKGDRFVQTSTQKKSKTATTSGEEATSFMP